MGAGAPAWLCGRRCEVAQQCLDDAEILPRAVSWTPVEPAPAPRPSAARRREPPARPAAPADEPMYRDHDALFLHLGRRGPGAGRGPTRAVARQGTSLLRRTFAPMPVRDGGRDGVDLLALLCSSAETDDRDFTGEGGGAPGVGAARPPGRLPGPALGPAAAVRRTRPPASPDRAPPPPRPRPAAGFRHAVLRRHGPPTGPNARIGFEGGRAVASALLRFGRGFVEMRAVEGWGGGRGAADDDRPTRPPETTAPPARPRRPPDPPLPRRPPRPSRRPPGPSSRSVPRTGAAGTSTI